MCVVVVNIFFLAVSLLYGTHCCQTLYWLNFYVLLCVNFIRLPCDCVFWLPLDFLAFLYFLLCQYRIVLCNVTFCMIVTCQWLPVILWNKCMYSYVSKWQMSTQMLQLQSRQEQEQEKMQQFADAVDSYSVEQTSSSEQLLDVVR